MAQGGPENAARSPWSNAVSHTRVTQGSHALDWAVTCNPGRKFPERRRDSINAARADDNRHPQETTMTVSPSCCRPAVWPSYAPTDRRNMKKSAGKWVD